MRRMNLGFSCFPHINLPRHSGGDERTPALLEQLDTPLRLCLQLVDLPAQGVALRYLGMSLWGARSPPQRGKTPQPRASPWVWGSQRIPSPEGAKQCGGWTLDFHDSRTSIFPVTAAEMSALRRSLSNSIPRSAFAFNWSIFPHFSSRCATMARCSARGGTGM